MQRRSFVGGLAVLSLFLLSSASWAEDEGFTTLFDGKTLANWTGSTGYIVEDGAIVAQAKGTGNLYTEKEYSNFVFRFEFRLTPGANNGIGLRVPKAGGDPAYVGMEIQVLDDSAEKYKSLQPYQYHGSIYGVVAAKKGHQKPVGEWNTEEITCNGKHVKVVLNGETIVDADIEKASTPKTIDGKNHPGLARESGHICFCGHGTKVEFRNLRVKELK